MGNRRLLIKKANFYFGNRTNVRLISPPLPPASLMVIVFELFRGSFKLFRGVCVPVCSSPPVDEAVKAARLFCCTSYVEDNITDTPRETPVTPRWAFYFYLNWHGSPYPVSYGYDYRNHSKNKRPSESWTHRGIYQSDTFRYERPWRWISSWICTGRTSRITWTNIREIQCEGT